MEFLDNLRTVFSDPNLGYILIVIAILGITIEVFTPGVYLGLVTSIVAGLLAFWGLSNLSLNPIGLILLCLALAFFIIEAFIKIRWVSTIIGLAFLILGSVLLFSGGSPSRANPYLIVCVTAVTAGIMMVMVNRAASAHKRRVAIGSETVLGSSVTAKTELAPEGMVMFNGELWKAKLKFGSAHIGDELYVVGVNGLTLELSKEKEK